MRNSRGSSNGWWEDQQLQQPLLSESWKRLDQRLTPVTAILKICVFQEKCGKNWLMLRFCQRLIDVEVLLDFDIWYSHWISMIAKYSERSWNVVRSHIPVILGPVPGAELRHTNRIPPSDFAANNRKFSVENVATVDELNTGMMFHPLPRSPKSNSLGNKSWHLQRGLEIWKPRWFRWPWKGNSVFRCRPCLVFCGTTKWVGWFFWKFKFN